MPFFLIVGKGQLIQLMKVSIDQGQLRKIQLIMCLTSSTIKAEQELILLVRIKSGLPPKNQTNDRKYSNARFIIQQQKIQILGWQKDQIEAYTQQNNEDSTNGDDQFAQIISIMNKCRKLDVKIDKNLYIFFIKSKSLTFRSITLLLLFKMQFKPIQQKLNRLCSQHDEYMALLDITDYLASLKHLLTNNKAVSNKIALLQQQIQQFHSGQNLQRSHQKELGTLKLEKLKKNIGNIQQKLTDYGPQFTQLNVSIKKLEIQKEQLACNQQLTKANIQVQGIVEKQTNILHSAIAAFKNTIESKSIQIEWIVNNTCTSTITRNHEGLEEQGKSQSQVNIGKKDQKSSILELFKPTEEAYDQLLHEIMLYKVHFPVPPLLPFIIHNCQAIKQNISWLYSKVNIHQQLDNSEFNILKQESESLGYRIKALKNHALCELLQLYQERENKLEVRRLEKQIEPLIRQLDNNFQLFSDFLSKAQLMQTSGNLSSGQK